MPAILSGLNEGLGSILGFFVALVPAIALHEMGHMFVAKWAGVWVREFGIGFPPRIAKLFQWQETEFTLNWIPLGGFARMEGEGYEENMSLAEEEEPDTRSPEEIEEARQHSLHTQPPGKRTLIFMGGPMMNLLTGWVLAVTLFLTGIPIADEMNVYIDAIAPNSPAEKAGLQSGDIFVAMNDQPITLLDAVKEITDENLGETVTVTVERDNEEVTVSLIPRADPPEGEGAMGVAIVGEPLAYHIKPYPPLQAIANGTTYYASILGQTLMAPIYIIQGLIPLEYARPSGIVGISRITYQTIQQSVTTGTLVPLFNLLILVNVSLGIFNLLPIPVLDGGHILFTIIEKVKGKALTPAVQQRVQQVAVIFFLLFFIAVTILDVLYPITLPSP